MKKDKGNRINVPYEDLETKNLKNVNKVKIQWPMTLTLQEIPLRHRGNYLYSYLVYTYNVFYEKREYSACYALILRASKLRFKCRTCTRNVRRARWYKKQTTRASPGQIWLLDAAEIIYICI